MTSGAPAPLTIADYRRAALGAGWREVPRDRPHDIIPGPSAGHAVDVYARVAPVAPWPEAPPPRLLAGSLKLSPVGRTMDADSPVFFGLSGGRQARLDWSGTLGLPHVAPWNVQTFLGNTVYRPAPITHVVVSHGERLVWKDMPADGRQFSVFVHFSGPMQQALRRLAPLARLPHEAPDKMVLFLPLFGDLPEDERPMTSPDPFCPRMWLPLPQVVLGEVDSDHPGPGGTAPVTSLRILTETVVTPPGQAGAEAGRARF